MGTVDKEGTVDKKLTSAKLDYPIPYLLYYQ